MNNPETETVADVLATDIRNLIVMDTQYGWRGSTELTHADILSLEARGWVAEGHENAEYDLTDEGRAVIERALSAQQPADPASTEQVLKLLVAGGFVDPAKVDQARAILADCALAKASGRAPDVETVARKLFESEQRNRSGEWTWAECSSIEREGWTELAQAAIEILTTATPPASAPEVTEWIDRLDGVIVYGTDTLSGPAEPVEDRGRWDRDGIREMVRRARELRAALTAALTEKSHG